MAKILLVEDDVPFSQIVKGWLTQEHHSVEVSHDGQAAQDNLAVFQYDLIILDWELPGMSGVDVLKEFRSHGGLTPILMLTGKTAVADKEAGLDSGADDYLTKPFHMKELSARVRALLRRASGLTSNVLKAGNLVLDPSNYRLTRGGEEIHLQKREFALLEFLMRNPNKVFSAEALMERVWASEADITPDAIRTCVMRLRKKIDSNPETSLIQNVHGVGYKLQAP
jgi:DNA-binding response OmpR family regulator